ncbi:MAG: ABC transporter substrate-binding protein [Candidatus Dormibacterales bacterium]
MRQRLTALAALAATLFLVASCGAAAAAPAPAYAGRTIHLAADLSLTGAGAVYGVSSKNGIDLAVEEINAAGGVDGARLAVSIADDGSARSEALQVVQGLVSARPAPLGLLGPTLSNSAVAVHPYAESAHVPIVGISNTGLHIVPDCEYPSETPCRYVFRDSLGEATAIPADIRVWQQRHHSRTAVLMVAYDDKFSADGGRVVAAAAPGQGLRLVQTIEFSKTATDLSPYVAEAVKSHPDVIFITSLGSIPARIMIEARAIGFRGGFLGGNGFNTAVVSQAAGAAGKGAQSASAWYLNSSFAANHAFVRDYRAAYAEDPDQFAAQAWTGVLIFAAAARSAHLTFKDVPADRDRLRAALEKVSLPTPLGPFQFTSAHDVSQPIWVIQMDGRGGFNLVSEVSPA